MPPGHCRICCSSWNVGIFVHVGGVIANMSSAPLTAKQQETLADRVRNREAAAEEELVRLFTDRIAFFVRMRTNDTEAARDLTQDVLWAVVHALRGGQLRDGERLGAFVYGVARNLVNNYVRSRCRAPRAAPLDAALHLAIAADRSDDIDRAGLVAQALTGLDSTDRTILALTLVEDLKPGEIGRRLSLGSDVVRTRKSRALKKVIERVRRLSRT